MKRANITLERESYIVRRVSTLQQKLHEEMVHCTPAEMRRLQTTHEVASLFGE